MATHSRPATVAFFCLLTKSNLVALSQVPLHSLLYAQILTQGLCQLQECSATVCHSARSWARLATPADHTMCQKIAPSGIHTTEVSCSRTLTLTHCSAHVRVGCTAQQPSASQLHWETTSAMTSQAFMMNTSDVHA